MLLDRVTLVLADHRSVEHLTYEDGTLEVGGRHLDLQNPVFVRVAELSLSSSGRAVLESGGRQFVLGPGHLVPDSGGLQKLAFTKDTGDKAVFTVEQSRFAWPTPFEMNFMTGYAPSRKRNVYLRLRWTKLNGAKLDIVWKTGQSYYSRDGWLPPRIESVTDSLVYVHIHESR